MKTTLLVTMLLGLCLVASMTPAHAAPISAATDAYVDSARPGNNLGGADPNALYVYNRSGREMRSLIQFDVSSIPTSGSIASAILTLRVDPGLTLTQVGGGQTFSAYRVTQQWVDWGVTWNDALYTVPWTWTTPGGDYDPAVHGDYVSPQETVTLTTLVLDITPIVQGWVNGTNPNYGVILTGTSGAGLGFYSREYTPGGQGPTLDITMVPEPFSLALLAFGGLLLFKRR